MPQYLSVISFIGFTYYINNFNQYNKLYGSIGTLLDNTFNDVPNVGNTTGWF